MTKLLNKLDNFLAEKGKGQFFNIVQDEKGKFVIQNKDDFYESLGDLETQLEKADYTDEDRAEFKKIRANFNKLSKILVQDLKDVKDFYFADLDLEIKSIKTSLESFSLSIKERLDESEERFRAEKLKVVEKMYQDELFYLDDSSLFNFDDIFDSSWLNRTATEKQIRGDLNFRVSTINNLLKDNLNQQRYNDIIQAMNENNFDSNAVFDIINRVDEIERERLARELAKKEKEELLRLEREAEEQRLKDEKERLEREKLQEKQVEEVKKYVTIKLLEEDYLELKTMMQTLGMDHEVLN